MTAKQPTASDIIRIYKHFGLVGEEELSIIQILGASSQQHYIIESLSGSGKSFTMDIMLDHLLPPDKTYTAPDGASPTQISYDAERINRAFWVYIPEMQNLIRNEIFLAMLKKITEGKSYVRSVRDQANDTSIDFEVSPERGFMTTLAIENDYKPDRELQRRMWRASTDISMDLNEKVVSAEGVKRLRLSPTDPVSKKELDAFIGHMTECVEFSRGDGVYKPKTIEVVNPFAPIFTQYVPMPDVFIRSFVKYVLDMFEASAVFHHKERMVEGDKLFVDLYDVMLVYEVYWDAFNYLIHGVGPVGQRVLTLFKMDGGEVVFRLGTDMQSTLTQYEDVGDGEQEIQYLTEKDIRFHLMKTGDRLKLTGGVLRMSLERLIDAGYLDKKTDYKTKQTYYWMVSDVEKTAAPDWNEVWASGRETMREHYPDQYKEWAEQSTDYISPITGGKTRVI